MTALAQYDLLEAEGRYFDGETAAAREVVVKFGDASLMILDHDDMPIVHWPLASLRMLDTAGDALTLIPDHGSNERLTIDDAVMADAIRQVCPDLDRAAPVARGRLKRAAFWAAAAIGSVYVIVFHLVPALSDQLAALIPPEAEVAMGEEMVDQIAAFIADGDEQLVCKTRAGDAAVQKMTRRLEVSAITHVPIRIQVFKSDMINAFALPGGQIVLFSGLIEKANSPEQLAGVLAHEVGHVAARDPTRLALRAAGSAGLLGLLLGDFTGATATVALSEALLRSGYQREAEAEADRYATELLGKMRLPTGPFADFFNLIAAEKDAGPGLLTHLSSHPDSTDRSATVRAADSVGDAPFTPFLTDQDWVALKGICG